MNLFHDGPAPKDLPIQRTMNRRRAGVFAAAVAALSLGSAEALAEQFVVLDSTWEHTPDLADSHYRVTPLPGTPSDWRKPTDYASGTAHVHLEVTTKPSATPTKFQVCFEATPTYACTDQSPTYTTVGVVDWETPFSNFWSPPGTAVDWTLGTKKIALILKDTQNGKPSADNVGTDKAALYMPTQVRMVVTIVAPGSTYVPPPPADAGVPVDTDAGADADAGPGDGGMEASTSTSASTGPQDSSDAGEDAGAGAGGAPSGAGKSDSGCGVAPDLGSTRPVAWIAFAVIAAGLSRLRRR
jgi:hypothetical protein